MRRLWAPLVVAALLVAAGAARADERILSFLSDVHVQRNGDLDVTETIRVEAEGRTIRHGIFRDFPTVYADAHGARRRVGFQVLSVKRDGAGEAYRTEGIANGVRIRIGRADATVPPGLHTYVIAYRTTRQIGFFGDFDELYWNATGNGWSLPIDQAVAAVFLPERVPFLHTAVYTGPLGATGHDARVVQQEPGRIIFRTTRPLPAHSGLTVAASWKKGIVMPPSGTEAAGFWLHDNLVAIVALAGGVLVLAYYVFAWVRVGRGPRRGTLVPLFEPPDGMSAAACRYLAEMGFDDRAFTAGILDLAVKGRLKLRDVAEGKTEIEPGDGTAAAAPAEEAMLGKLFAADRAPIVLEQANHRILDGARTALKGGLAKEFASGMFTTNLRWSILGAGLSVVLALLVALAAAATGGEDAATAVLVPVPGVAVGAALLARVFISDQGGRWFFALFGLFFGGIFAVVGVGAGGEALGPLAEIAVLGAAAVLAVVASTAFGWMKAPTREGRALMDRIAGFRRYLGVAEERELEALHPPEKTPALFERFLPYAIALGVENHWAERFAGVLAAAAAAGTSPTWYPGHSGFGNPVAFAGALGSGLTGTIASAATAPGSSSGSSGGGSSGGGGGGGGGGGW